MSPANRSVASAQTIEQLGSTLFDLYRASRELDLNDFPLGALKLLGRAVPFDFAWWGMYAEIPGDNPPVLHTSFTLNVPAGYLDQWRRIMDSAASKNVEDATPGITMVFQTHDVSGTDLHQLLTEFHIEQVLLTTQFERPLGLRTFLALYRTKASPRITDTERLLNQALMPHLVEARNTNWIAQLTRMRALDSSAATAAAIADRTGVLYASDPRFHQLVCTEWPNWQGAYLPEGLRSSIASGRAYDGKSVIAQAFATNELYLLQLRARSPLDQLSPRERVVAEEFAKGRSHKEVASQLKVAPVTVRHHLRRVYEKLQVGDKAQLASMLSDFRRG
jgi:DNA-binding CsgD family transcriptional regulator